jgi:hypothetical protein
MRKIILFLLVVSTGFIACKKENEENKEYNKIRITSGSDEGFTYQFTPNEGIWAWATQETKSFGISFGDNAYPPNKTTNYGDLFFYNTNIITPVQFPSPEGQKMQFVLRINDQDCPLQAIDATLKIELLSDTKIIGFISGEFQHSCSSSTCTIEMDFEVELTTSG